MKVAGMITVTAIAILSGIGGALAAAQDAPSAVSDPLKNYTLDVLVPARSAGAVEAKQAVARERVAAAKNYHEKAAQGRELVKTRLTAKDIEVKALEARVKEAKATGDKAELESLKAQINAQKSQLDALQNISGYAGTWDELAGALERAGNEWLEFLEAENAVAQRQEGLSRELVKKADSPMAGQPTPEDFKLHKKLVQEYQEYGAALENLGKVSKKLGESSAKVLAAWENRNLAK